MYDVIVIGSGPAGMMASIMASKNNKVLLLEKNDISGKKLLITGGGRCNLTNLKNNREFIEEVEYNKKYLYSTINNFGPKDIYDFFTSKGVKLKEEKGNNVFPVSNKSSEILMTLLDSMKKVDIKYKENVIDIKVLDEIKEVVTMKNIYRAKNIIIATGGSSFKETGSSGDNMKFARLLGQPTVNLFPAETYLELKEDTVNLAGTSFEEVEVSYLKKKKSGNLIFTHKGISGSSVMKISEFVYLNKDKSISIDLLPKLTVNDLINDLNRFDREKEISVFLMNYFSKRFSNYLVSRYDLHGKIKAYNIKNLIYLFENLKSLKFEVASVGPIEKAYVTGGGIDLKYIDSKTMESKINKGIYFVGESLDIHGPIGGYNITLALSTGYSAGISINNKMS